MRDSKIALLIDVDNVKIGSAAFHELYEELKERGEVVYCKFYGYNDRKHNYLSDIIAKYGYETAPFMRFKKRFSQLDNRILVDAVKLNYTKPEINTYCIVAGDGDLIPLLVELKSSGRQLLDVNTEYQEMNGHMFDEHIVVPSIDSGAEVYTSKANKTPKMKPVKAKPAATKPEPKPAPAPVAAPKVEVKKPEPVLPVVEEEDEVESDELEMDYNLSQVLRSITERYNELDFSDSSEMAKKLKLIKDIEELIASENAKGEGIYSANPDIRQIFSDLQDVVDDMKNAL
jgi:DNA polymerase III delta prime subunit